MADDSIFSPATDLDSINAGGSTGGAGDASIFPDYQVVSRGAEAPGTSEFGAVGGVGSTQGAVPFAQLIDVTASVGNLGGPDTMVGGLGDPPRP